MEEFIKQDLVFFKDEELIIFESELDNFFDFSIIKNLSIFLYKSERYLEE